MIDFMQVDVFSPEPCRGNPLAVVLDGTGLDDEVMQRFAAWTNLSETAFLLPATDPRADYRVRIFTPLRELPFAGHPTLGSAHAWSQAAGSSPPERIVQECEAGLVEVRRASERLAFAAPPLIRSGPLDDATLEEVRSRLHLGAAEVVDHAWADNGPGWAAVLLADPERLLSLRPVPGALPIGAVAIAAAQTLEVRAFMRHTAAEDPATGSLNAGVAQWLLATGRMQTPYIARQGTALHRTGRLHIDVRDGQVWVGGDTRTVISGSVAL